MTHAERERTPSHHATLLKAVFVHVSATVFPFVASWLRARIRARRFDTECRPILEKLLSMKRAREEGPAWTSN
jgi:hypothetical protein